MVEYVNLSEPCLAYIGTKILEKSPMTHHDFLFDVERKCSMFQLRIFGTFSSILFDLVFYDCESDYISFCNFLMSEFRNKNS